MYISSATPLKENYIGSVVSEIVRYTQTDILSLLYKGACTYSIYNAAALLKDKNTRKWEKSNNILT